MKQPGGWSAPKDDVCRREPATGFSSQGCLVRNQHSQNAYVAAVAILVISWTPNAGFLQLLNYIGPVAIALLAVYHRTARVEKTDAAYLVILLALGSLNALMHVDTGPIHPVLGLLTYASVVVVMLRFRGIDDETLVAFTVAVAWVSIAEAAIAFVQLMMRYGQIGTLDLAAGDYARGTTMSAFSHLFALKQMFQGTFLVFMAWQASGNAHVRRNRRLIMIGGASAILMAILASFTSGFILFVGVIATWRILVVLRPLLGHVGTVEEQRRRFRNGITTLGALAVGALSAAIVLLSAQPKVVGNTFALAEVVLSGDAPNHPSLRKFTALNASIREVLLGDPVNAAFGLGLGRYSSRAAMILTGVYLGHHPDVIPISMSRETYREIFPRWSKEMQEITRGSIMTMPTSSFQSFLVEFGFLGTLILVLYTRVIWKRTARIREFVPPGSPRAVVLTMAQVFVALLAVESLTDLWLEFSACSSFVYLILALALSVPAVQPARALEKRGSDDR